MSYRQTPSFGMPFEQRYKMGEVFAPMLELYC